MEKVLRALLYSMNLEEDKTENAVARIKERKMGRLFEGVTFDFQAAVKEAAEKAAEKAAKEAAKEATKKATEEAAIEAAKELEISRLIVKMLMNQRSDIEIKESLEETFSLSKEQAEEAYRKRVE